MKKTLLLASGILAIIALTSCEKTQAETTGQSQSQTQEQEEVKRTGWNDPEVAKYASFVNGLMKNAGYTGFWWDCNGIIDRNNLTCRQEIVDAIMAQYPAEEYSYTKTTRGFIEEDAATAVHNMKTGWIVQWGEKDAEGNVTVKAFETAWGIPETTQENYSLCKRMWL